MSSYIKQMLGLIKIGCKTALQYKFEFVISVITTPVSLIIYYFLWKSVYSYSGAEIIGGFTFQQMISYYVLSMIIGFFTWSEIDKWMEQDILKGYVIRLLSKPVSFLSIYLLFEAGINMLSIVVEMIPVFIIGLLFFGLEIAPLFNLAAFFVSLVLAFFLYFYITFIVGLSAFWLKRTTGIRRVRRVVMAFLSGGMIPLTFFPVWFQALSNYLPFQYFRFVPVSIYLARYTPLEVCLSLLVQAAWVAGLYLAIRIIWMRAFKKFAGVGV